MLEPSKATKAIYRIVPTKVKKASAALGTKITQLELYQQAMEIISNGFNVVEEQVCNLKTNTRNKLYVALTRAHGKVYLVDE